MIDLNYERPVNVSLLHDEIKAQIGAMLVGVSATGDQVTVHVDDLADSSVTMAVDAVVAAHDENVLTPEQQAETDRETTLAALDKPWATWSSEDKDTFIYLLAREVIGDQI